MILDSWFLSYLILDNGMKKELSDKVQQLSGRWIAFRDDYYQLGLGRSHIEIKSNGFFSNEEGIAYRRWRELTRYINLDFITIRLYYEDHEKLADKCLIKQPIYKFEIISYCWLWTILFFRTHHLFNIFELRQAVTFLLEVVKRLHIFSY